ncbi:MAG: hypothetical protein IJY55_05250 [Clostridia bacterium]|nr:hypothetical protein [Clostridia bacterium]
MKESIYTIPVTDAFLQEEKCPFCYIEDKLENEAVEYALGPSMMEPDIRQISNRTGYCRHHLKAMYDKNERLSMALMLSTHLVFMKGELEKAKIEGGGLFSKSKDDISALEACSSSCVICEKLEKAMDRYISNFCHTYGKDKEFRKIVAKSKPICAHHSIMVIKNAPVNAGELKKNILYRLGEAMDKNIGDIQGFIDMFDHRNFGKEQTADVKEALKTLTSFLRGSVENY